MSEDIKKLLLNFPREEYIKFKKEFEKVMKLKKNQYSNLNIIFDSLKQKNIQLSFLFFSQYKKWIFPSISYNNIISFNKSISETIFSSIFKQISQNINFPLKEQIFILWYFYLFSKFFHEDLDIKTNLINNIRYLLLKTNKVIFDLYEKRNLTINQIFNILDFCLISLEFYINSLDFANLCEKSQNIKKILFFKNIFDLIQNISVISLKVIQTKDFELILNYLLKINENSMLNDELNKILLIKNNIIQDFILNLLDNINNIELLEVVPKYKGNLIRFYTHYLVMRYNISNLFSNFMDATRKSFEHLYNFKANKNSIIKDISINNFNSILLNELYSMEKENNINQRCPLQSSFLFSHKNSIISIKLEKATINKSALFFSFQIGKENNNTNEELPLLIIQRKNNQKGIFEIIIKIFLKKVKSTIKGENKYNLCFSQSNNQNYIKINSDNFLIDDRNIYYCCFSFKENKIYSFLYCELLKKNNDVFNTLNLISEIKGESDYIFTLGNDNSNSFYKGNIGPLVMIKYQNKDIMEFVGNILLLKDKYSDFLLTKFNLSQNYDFSLKEYYEQNSFFDITDKNSLNDKNKESFRCLLYLHPNIFKYSKSKIIKNEEESINKFNDIFNNIMHDLDSNNTKNKIKYTIIKLKISLMEYDNVKNLFIKDNGLDYIVLQLEYFYQFSRYFLLKEKKNIYNEKEKNIIIEDIMISLKKYILLLGYHSQSKYLYNSYKKIFVSLYNCLLNLDKIKPIIHNIFIELRMLKDIYKGAIINSKNCSKAKKTEFSNNIINNSDRMNNKNNQIEIQINTENSNYNLFFKENINYYIGIIEILLTTSFYNNFQKEENIKLVQNLFKNLLSNYIVFEGNDNDENINITFYQNIFYKLLNFVYLICGYFDMNKEMTDEQKNIYTNLLISNFKLLTNILNTKSNKNICKEYFNKIFRFVFRNNKDNPFIIYSYLHVMYEFIKENPIFSFNKNEIKLLKLFLVEFNKQYFENNQKKKIEIIIISILLEDIYSNPNENITNNSKFIKDYIQDNNISEELFSQIKNIIEKFVNDIFKEDNIFVTKNLTNKEIMDYFWSLFMLLVIIIKKIKISNFKNDNDIKKHLYEIINIFLSLDTSIGNSMNLNKRKKFVIIYLINFLKFLNYILYDDEIIFLLNDRLFLNILDSAINNCLHSTLMYSDNYILINESNFENKKLCSQIFFDIFQKIIEQNYNKYKSSGEEIIEEDIIILKNLSNLIDKRYIVEFIYKNYNLKKETEYDSYKTIFFTSDFLKLTSDKKYSKKYEKNKVISQRIQSYKEMKEIMHDIYKNDITFEFYFSTQYFYEIYEFKNKINSYIKDESIISNIKLIKLFNELQSILFKFNIIILNDHLKLFHLNKDFFHRKIQNMNDNQENTLKNIQLILFGKKNKINYDILPDYVIQIEKNFDDVNIGRRSEAVNPKFTEEMIIEKTKKKKRYSFDINDSIKNKTNFNDEEENNKKKNKLVNNYINDPDNDKDDIPELNNDIEEFELFELPKELYSKNIFDKIDKTYIINPKKQLMKIIFGIFFEESFFNNKTFKKLKNYYLNHFPQTESCTKLLNYPSKIKSFTNGLDLPLFLKENKKFFISKIFPISHKFFYNFMIEHNILNDSIILNKKYFSLQSIITGNSEIIIRFDCELIKIEKTYFGQLSIISSMKDEFLLFEQKKFHLSDNEKNLKEELEKNIFSLSSLEWVITDNAKEAKQDAKNILLDEDIFYDEELNNNKRIIIFLSDIEEIVERRILFLWQGIEIFLKNGKSYIFNMLTIEHYSAIKDKLQKIPTIVFRERDYFSKKSGIMQYWIDEKLDTYDYLLFLNKYSSRSLNDSSQYYVFPWIIINFENIIEINKKESDIYEKIKDKLIKEREQDEDENNQKEDIIVDIKDDEYLSKLYNNLRKLKYVISVQTKANRESKLEKYKDEDEKFPHHFGTHYSTSSYIYYYLMRLEPFTSLLIELQNYTQENPDRMLNDLKDTIKIVNSGNDNRELIPELFSKVDYFINVNCSYFGHKKNKKIIDDINKIWIKYTDKYYNNISLFVRFIFEHKKLLNSKTIATQINYWIDNIFGVGQYPKDKKKRENSLNIFIKTAYIQETDLHRKLNKIIKKETNKDRIKKKLINKINLITSFGQNPQQIFEEKHKKREINFLDKSIDFEEHNPENYGHQTKYIGNDFIDTFFVDEYKNDNNVKLIKIFGIYFETNSLINKLFILSESNYISIIDTSFYNIIEPKKYYFNEIKTYKLPYMFFFDNIYNGRNTDYILKVKYSFSSFPSDIINIKDSSLYLYSNQNFFKADDDDNTKEYTVDKFKYITCRYFDNSFKIHSFIMKGKKIKEEIYSYVCEDFVMSCKTISPNSFIIGLQNGKLIKAMVYEIQEQKNSKDKKKEEEDNINKKYKIKITNYIKGHNGSINLIEVDERIGVVITAGDDNKLCIRKLIDFELLTCIKIKSKFVVSMAKISPMNLLYIMCFNLKRKETIIFGYTLSGLKFAKSEYSSFANIDFTKNGNIISLLNENKVTILEGHNLDKIKINENGKDYKLLHQVEKDIKGAKWMQFNYFKNYRRDRNIISYLSLNYSKEFEEECNFLKTLKATNISYFD